MKIFDSAKHLENMLESMIKKLDNELIKSLVGYELYKKSFSIFSNV